MKLPPLNALRAFEAAARHSSFAKAAEEMYVSPAAVSRHVKNLEDHLSLTLFDRKAQGIALTEVGRQLLPELTDAFQRISGAAIRARMMSNEIRVLVGPTFGVRWLIPRLPQFHELYPAIHISMALCIDSERWSQAAYDVGIVEGWWVDGVAPEDSERRVLRYERLAPVCAPAFARRPPRLRKPSDLRDRPLLHAIDTKDWDAWLGGVGETGVPVRQDAVYRTGDAAARAAIAGNGVAIVNLDLYKYELDSGQLVAPFDFVLSDASPLIFFCFGQRLAEPAIASFYEWLEAALRQ